MDQIAENPTLPIIQKILAQSDRAEVRYCHWKSNAFIERSASGWNDLDLLVARESRDAFLTILHSNAFKEVVRQDATPGGITSLYGYDLAADSFVHVHAHFQLILGHDATKNFHLPVEEAYIRRAKTSLEFRVAEPAAELILLVIRLYLKHYTLEFEKLLARHPELTRAVIASLASRLRRLVELVQELSLKDARGRFLEFLREASGGQSTFELHLSHQEIAAHIGTVREIVSRLFGPLAREGVLQVEGRTVTILRGDGI